MQLLHPPACNSFRDPNIILLCLTYISSHLIHVSAHNVDEPSKDPNIILSTLSSYIFCLLNSWPAGVLGRVI